MLALFSKIYFFNLLDLTVNFVRGTRITLLAASSSFEAKWKKTYVLRLAHQIYYILPHRQYSNIFVNYN